MTEYIYDVTDAAVTAGPTPSQTVGPFFHIGLPYDTGPDVAGPDRPGVIRLHGRVLDGAGNPVPDSLVEIWQPDETGDLVTAGGVYAEVTGTGFRGFGRAQAGSDGHYSFRTVRPGAVSTTDGAPQAPHIAMQVFARGMLRQVATRVYFPEDADAHVSDPLLSALPEDRRSTLVASADPDGYRFDVHLQGDQETVFLDIFRR